MKGKFFLVSVHDDARYPHWCDNKKEAKASIQKALEENEASDIHVTLVDLNHGALEDYSFEVSTKINLFGEYDEERATDEEDSYGG